MHVASRVAGDGGQTGSQPIGPSTVQVDRANLVEYLTARMAGMDHAASEPLLKTVTVTAALSVPLNASPLNYREILLKLLAPVKTEKTVTPKAEKAVK